MKWLVTGFAPFQGAQSNSSQILVKELARRDWGGSVVFHQPVPVTFADAWADVERVLKPDVDGILALGQSEPRGRISLERVALNFIDANIADNAGQQPHEKKVLAQGPEMYWSNIPWQDFASAPGKIERSYSAGTFVCNTLMYQLMNWAARNGKLGGFVHVPLLPSQIDPQYKPYPRMADQEAIEHLTKILEFLVAL